MPSIGATWAAPAQAFLQGCQQAHGHNCYKCNKRQRYGKRCRHFHTHVEQLNQHQGRHHLDSASDSWYLEDRSERNEPHDNQTIYKCKTTSCGEGPDHTPVARRDERPLQHRVGQRQGQGGVAPHGFAPARKAPMAFSIFRYCASGRNRKTAVSRRRAGSEKWRNPSSRSNKARQAMATTQPPADSTQVSRAPA